MLTIKRIWWALKDYFCLYEWQRNADCSWFSSDLEYRRSMWSYFNCDFPTHWLVASDQTVDTILSRYSFSFPAVRRDCQKFENDMKIITEELCLQ